jgi:hypothetical protein
MIAVLLDSSHGLFAYGPYDEDDRPTAEGLAAFLTVTVDPAKVVPAEPLLGKGAGVAWRSALGELLAWYEHTQGGGDD